MKVKTTIKAGIAPGGCGCGADPKKRAEHNKKFKGVHTY